MAGILAVALLLLAGALWAGGGPPGTVWSNTVGMRFVAVDNGSSESPAYDLDTLSRTGLVRTLAGIATNPQFVSEAMEQVSAEGFRVRGVTVDTSGSVRSALVLVTARGPDPQVTERVALAVRSSAMDFINARSPLYAVREVAGDPVLHKMEPAFDRRLALLPLLLAAMIGVGLVLPPVRGRPRGRHRPRRRTLSLAGRDRALT